MPTIQEKVAEKLVNSGSFVSETVIDKLAQIELDKRVELVTKAMKKVEELEKELKKINRPDSATYIGDVRTEITTENRYKEIAKAKEKVLSLTKAFDAALETNTTESYLKLTETLNKVGNGPTESKKPDSTEVKSAS
jgi:uncharacterized membrane-anchored protein